MKKILFVSSSSHGGGAERQLIETVKLLRDDYEIRICTLGERGVLFGEFLKLDPNLSYSKSGFLSDCATLTKALMSFKPQITVNWLYKANILGAITSRILGTSKIINTLRNTRWTNYGFWKLFLVRISSNKIASITVANSENAKRWHVNQGFVSDKIEVISNLLPNCIPVKPDSVAGRKIRLGIASRAVDGKGHATLLRALEQNLKLLDNYELHLIGDGVGNWHKIIGNLKNLGVTFTARDYTFELDSWFQKIDVYVAISESWESDSNSLLEAILYNKIVICSSLQNTVHLRPTPLTIPVGNSTLLANILFSLVKKENYDAEQLLALNRRESLLHNRSKAIIRSNWIKAIEGYV